MGSRYGSQEHLRKDVKMFSLNTGLFTYFLNLWQIDSVSRPVPYYVIFFSLILITIASGYLLGSINPSIILSRVFYHDDIRSHGSGNAGMTNVMRTYGKKAALFTLAGDTLKTALAVFIGGLCFGFGYVGGIATGEGGYVAGLFAVVGHIYPAYYKMKGGKGVLVTATMALILTPIPFAIIFLLFAGVLALSKYVSLASVSAAVMYPVAVYATFKVMFAGSPIPGLVALSTILIACLIVYAHRGNLQRISDRTERKFSFGKKPENDESEHTDDDGH
ncbi:MAG TPA: acyl-phosphate glycerol 3-phosphate acyltransferase [Clostridiales bacterium]|nr:acyl-phosphate glycerol 3-phosphate acyltransferase [Clostridiales bacterium]